MTRDLSIIIPARNEMFLTKTVEDILSHIEANTEIVIILDGAWADPPVPDHERITLVSHNVSIGQRAATNEAAKLAEGKYIMKVDAHCSFDQGFDRKMISEMHDDWTMIPLMKNLHAFDWVCPNGHRRYQGPSGPCLDCGKETTRDVVWIAKESPKSASFCFDSTPHFQYFNDYLKRTEAQGDISETMSIQGSCFMASREKYFELNLCDENFGGWGSQGIEVACKTWLSGGRVVCNKKTWYAHLFRTQGGDFSFPYPMSGKQVEHAKSYARELFFNDKWPQQTKPLSWLVEKFWPVKGWTDEDLAKLKSNTFNFDEKPSVSKVPEVEPIEEVVLAESPKSNVSGIVKVAPLESKITPKKGIIFYTDNKLNLKIAHAVQKRLTKIAYDKQLPIISCSLKKMTFGDKNIHFPTLKRGYLTMFKQILGGLENSEAEIVFFCEHDVLYHPSHFDFVPLRKSVYYYNTNVWKLLTKNGKAIWTDNCQQLSGMCAYRELLIKHYRKLIKRIEKDGFSRKIGFEPGTHNRAERIDDFKAESWKSDFPNIDIRHDSNLTETKTSPKQFRNQKFAKGWKTAKEIPGWGPTLDLVGELVKKE